MDTYWEETTPELDALATNCIEIARDVRRSLGIGMYERVYQNALSLALDDAGVAHQREVLVRATYRGRDVGPAYRVDLLVEGRLVLEIKSTLGPHPVHDTQLITYLRGGKWPLGYVLNFGTTPFFVKRRICSEFL